MKEGPKDSSTTIFTGMCTDVRMMMESKRYIATIILMFSAIDALGIALRRNSKGTRTQGADFKHWVKCYLKLPGDKPTPEELWLARCAMLHTYGVITKGHIKGNHRIINFVISDTDECINRIVGDERYCLINLDMFHRSFQSAVQRSLVSAMEAEDWRDIIVQRLNQFVQPVELDPDGPTSQFLAGH